MILIVLILFFIIAVFAFFPLKTRILRISFFLVLAFLLIIIAGFRPGESFRDYDMYEQMFEDQSDAIVEPAFIVLSSFCFNIFGNNNIYIFIIFACFGVSFKFLAIKQLTTLWLLTILIYFSNFFILHEMTQIRAGVASALLLLCVKPIHDRNLKLFLFLSLLALSFHYSALMILPLWFLDSKPHKKWLIVLIPISYIMFFLGINLIMSIPIPGIKEKIEIYQQLYELGGDEWTNINLFNLVFLARIAIFYFLIYKYDLILSYNKYFPILMKIYCISLISYPILATIPAIATRINELYGIVDIILIPFISYIFKPVYFSKVLVVLIGLSFLLIVLFYVKLIE